MAALQKTTRKNFSGTVIIPTFSRSDLALKLAEKIRSFYTPDELEVIIVEQKSKSDIREQTKNYKYIQTSIVSLPHARNEGIKHATGEIVIFFDDDVEITNTTIDHHLNAYHDDSIIGTSGRVINDADELPKDLSVLTGKTNNLGTKFIMNFWSIKEQYIDFPYGCNMSFKKSVLETIEYFDEYYPPPLSAFEEIDTAIQARKFGKIKFVPEALIYHHKYPSGGTRLTEKEKYKLYYQSYGHYLSKNVPFPLSLLSLGIKAKTAMIEAPSALINLLLGYIHYGKKTI